MLSLLASAIWFMLPAYVANMAPVALGGGPPIDGGRQFADGRPIFGAGKTWRGFCSGIGAGAVVGSLQSLASSSPLNYLLLALLLPLGAMLGDLAGSFIKRRLGIPRGGAAPVLDQLDFAIGALLLASLVHLPGLDAILTIIIITPPLHLAANFVGYKLGLKGRPY